MAEGPFDEDKTSVAPSDQLSAPRAELGTELPPTAVVPWAGIPARTQPGLEAGPTSVVSLAPAPLPRDFESTHVVPWSDATPGIARFVEAGPTDTRGLPPLIESEATDPHQLIPDRPRTTPVGFLALGSDADPMVTRAQPQPEPPTRAAPVIKRSLPQRIVKRFTGETRLKPKTARIVVFALAAIGSLIVLLALFQLVAG